MAKHASSDRLRAVILGVLGVCAAVGWGGAATAREPAELRFRHHVIDTDLSGSSFGQTALVDLTGDGRPEFVMGLRGGALFVYQYQAPDRWTRYIVGRDSPSEVGLTAFDVDGDGRIDLVTGGAWYRNSGDLATPFERIVFDEALRAVHDMAAADIDGDGRLDVVTMSDRNNLRWYKIPKDPRQPWRRHDIGPAVHAGLAVGDLSGNGRLDVVRTNVWFENVRGDGTEWVERPIGPSSPPPPDFRPAFAFDATKAIVVDMTGNGVNDIVFTDAEIPGGKVWWMENLDGKGTRWRRHDVPLGDPVRRGAFHSLQVADFTGDGRLDIFTAEMEAVRGQGRPRWFIWENLDGQGTKWHEHVVLDANLGGHEALAGDVTGNGRLDIIGKPWRPHPQNAAGGKPFVVFLENVSP
jgi:hypothetical protein